MSYNSKAFTLVELLVVIAIISLLATVVLSATNKARLKGKVARTIAQMRQIQQAVMLYMEDTGKQPPSCRLDCTETTDPLLTNVGSVSGWNGPYIQGGVYNRKHQWGGHMGIYVTDYDNNGKQEVWIILDDDAPGTNFADNSGQIPDDAMQMLDDKIDDGNVHTGTLFVGDGTPPFATGEAAWLVSGSEL